jgi:hypothetical protein
MVRLARNLVPVSILVSIGARYAGTYFAVGVALLAQSVLAFMFLRARTRFGKQSVVAESDRLVLSESNTTIRRRKTIGWTLSDRLARVYGDEHSYRLVVTQGDVAELGAALTAAFGPITVTVRRGSLRARTVALSVCISGIIALGTAVFFELLVLALIGIAAAILGGATFGALSQRIAR